MQEAGEQKRQMGCAWALLGLNTLVIGLFVASFARGPFSSEGQELWYRYGSLAFLLAGAVLPAIALVMARRIRGVTVASTLWMLIALLAFLGFAMMSSGGA